MHLHSYLSNYQEATHIIFQQDGNFPVSIGKLTLTTAAPPLSSSTSDELITIYYFYKSTQEFEINSQCFNIFSNDLLIINTHTTYHSKSKPIEPLKLYYIQFDPKKFIDVNFAFDQTDGTYIINNLSNLSNKPFQVGKGLKLCLENLLITAKQNAPLTNTMFRNRLLTVLTEIIKYSQCNISDSSSFTYDCAGYIKENICEPININELADLCHLSVSQFNVRFRKEFHLPPNEYILREKINHSKTLLTDSNLNITTISYKLSFSSSQYFCTVFKRFTGLSPKEFKKLHTSY